MKQYLELLEHVMRHGRQRPDRTGIGTFGVFGYQLRHDLAMGFPLLTTKQVWFRGVVEELFWMLSGSTSAKPLQEKGVHIWDSWAKVDGDLGPVYGKQWRDFGGVDQITQVLASIKSDPYGRRHVVTAWNPPDLPAMALPPCPAFFQFHVSVDGRLSLHLYQRSADAFLGVPFDIAGYALLTHMVAHETGHRPGDLVISYGDLHIYKNHLEQVGTQLTRTPTRLPRLTLNQANRQVLTLGWEDLLLTDYEHQGALPAPIAV